MRGRSLVAWLLVGALALGCAYAVVRFLPPLFRVPAPAPEISVPAAPAPEVKKAPKKRVQVKQPVQVYDDRAKFNLKLPEAVTKDPEQHVLAATQVRGSDRPQTVTTVIDERTGESQTFVKSDPYPWIALEHRAEVRVAYGYRFTPSGSLPSVGSIGNTVKPVGRISFTYDALRVKALTLGATAQVDTDGQTFVGVGVAYRW